MFYRNKPKANMQGIIFTYKKSKYYKHTKKKLHKEFMYQSMAEKIILL